MFLHGGRTLLAPHSSSPRLVWEKEQGGHARFSQLETSSLWQTACPQDTYALPVSAVWEGASLWWVKPVVVQLCWEWVNKPV